MKYFVGANIKYPSMSTTATFIIDCDFAIESFYDIMRLESEAKRTFDEQQSTRKDYEEFMIISFSRLDTPTKPIYGGYGGTAML